MNANGQSRSHCHMDTNLLIICFRPLAKLLASGLWRLFSQAADMKGLQLNSGNKTYKWHCKSATLNAAATINTSREGLTFARPLVCLSRCFTHGSLIPFDHPIIFLDYQRTRISNITSTSCYCFLPANRHTFTLPSNQEAGLTLNKPREAPAANLEGLIDM